MSFDKSEMSEREQEMALYAEFERIAREAAGCSEDNALWEVKGNNEIHFAFDCWKLERERAALTAHTELSARLAEYEAMLGEAVKVISDIANNDYVCQPWISKMTRNFLEANQPKPDRRKTGERNNSLLDAEERMEL